MKSKSSLKIFFINLNFLAWIFISHPTPCMAQESLRLPTYDAGVFDPSKGEVTVKYYLLKDADEVEVLVEDFRGQVIDRMNFVELRAGDHEFNWKGLDENEEKLPDGRYRFNMQARFTDGTVDRATVAIRIVTTAEERVMPPPEPLPPRKQIYKIDGSLSTFRRRNTEDPEDKYKEGEQRVRTHLNIRGETRVVDALFSMRRPYSSEASYNGSRAMAEQRWTGGKIKGVFRQGLGNLDDPMKFFSDFRTARKKVGARLDQAYKWFGINALCFSSEGTVDSEEKGLAGRMTFGPPDGWRLGLNYAKRDAVPGEQAETRSSYASSGDIRIPLWDRGNLLMEYARTEDINDETDKGYLVKVEHDGGGLRGSAGYYNLGENFAADFADPLRQVRSDARGVEVIADYLRREPLWVFKTLALGLRTFVMRTRSSNEKLKEGDGSLRLGVGEKDTLLFNWFGREEGENRTNSMVWSGRHAWNDQWSSTLQANFTRTKLSGTWRWMLDTGFSKEGLSCRLALEKIRRVIETSPDSPYEETAFRFDMFREPWRLNLIARHNRRTTDAATNLFSRFAFEPEFLHRYKMIAYLALGNRSAFKTEKQVEMGLELRF